MLDIPHYKSFSTYELSSEQDYAVHLALTRHENLKIHALAGTGKTSTLRAISANLASKKILYLAFNKTVQMEASSSFPRNVSARTIHSLAYRFMGIFDGGWQTKLARRWTLKDYAKFLDRDLNSSRMMKAITCLKEALKEFQNSSDRIPSSKHIPSEEWQGIQSPLEKQWICNLVDMQAPRLWEAMIDSHNLECPITHDTYLKLWQLSNPKITGIDVIMLDEAQDANPVMVDILKQQKSRLILVGDTWQQIYSFRGAVNAMKSMHAPLTSFLTQSFRFGQDIADLANEVLKLRSAEKFLRGHPKKLSALGPIDLGKKHTVIFRTNIELLEEAVDLASNRFRIHIVGSLERTAALVLDVYALFSGSKVKDAKLRVFKTWSDLEDNMDIIDDLELKKSFQFVKRYAYEVPKMIQTVKKADAISPEASDIILTTGHKSKGQEWDYVRVSEDFYEAIRKGDDEEWNLLYVAFTRAIVQLEVPPVILEYLTMKHKKKPTPVYHLLDKETFSEFSID